MPWQEGRQRGAEDARAGKGVRKEVQGLWQREEQTGGGPTKGPSTLKWRVLEAGKGRPSSLGIQNRAQAKMHGTKNTRMGGTGPALTQPAHEWGAGQGTARGQERIDGGRGR